MKRLFLLLTISISFSILHTFSQEPTRWRGENASGIYNETGLITQITSEGLPVAWSYEGLGIGFSSPVFANGKIYLTGMEEETGYIYILSEKGEFIKKFPYGKEFTKSFEGSRSTPVVVGDKVYMLSGEGVVYCLNSENGNTIWNKNLFTDFDGKNIQWGVTETVLIDGDKLFVSPGGEKNNVIALNRNNGDLIWSCPGLGELSAYCTPQLIELPSRKLLVTMMASHILGIDAETGKMLWSYEQKNQWSVHANTPVYCNGSILCASGYGKGMVKLKLNEDGSEVSKEWFSEDMDNRIGGIVCFNDKVYGSGDKNRAWFEIDLNSGNTLNKATDLATGVIIAADNKLFCYSDKGDLALYDLGSGSMTFKGKFKIELGSGQHWAHPVILNGKLYLRHGNTLIAYKIK